MNTGDEVKLCGKARKIKPMSMRGYNEITEAATADGIDIEDAGEGRFKVRFTRRLQIAGINAVIDLMVSQDEIDAILVGSDDFNMAMEIWNFAMQKYGDATPSEEKKTG